MVIESTSITVAKRLGQFLAEMIKDKAKLSNGHFKISHWRSNL